MNDTDPDSYGADEDTTEASVRLVGTCADTRLPCHRSCSETTPFIAPWKSAAIQLKDNVTESQYMGNWVEPGSIERVYVKSAMIVGPVPPEDDDDDDEVQEVPVVPKKVEVVVVGDDDDAQGVSGTSDAAPPADHVAPRVKQEKVSGSTPTTESTVGPTEGSTEGSSVTVPISVAQPLASTAQVARRTTRNSAKGRKLDAATDSQESGSSTTAASVSAVPAKKPPKAVATSAI